MDKGERASQRVIIDLRREFASAEVRRELLGLCRLLTGDAHTAEDAVQETLLEALRRADTLPEPEAWRPWLSGVARNVCRRWRQRRGLEARRVAPYQEVAAFGELLADDAVAEIDARLERADIAALLDRAIALLPAESGRLLVEHYAEGTPQSESAARRGVTENSIAVQLHRSKRTLHCALLAHPTLRAQAAAFGFLDAADAQGWQESVVWCCWCGQGKIAVRLTRHQSGPNRGQIADFEVACPHCNPDRHILADATTRNARLQSERFLQGVRSFRPALNRLNAHWGDWYAQGTAGETTPCFHCGRRAAQIVSPAGVSAPSHVLARTKYPIHSRCAVCRGEMYGTPSGVAIHSKAFAAFFRAHTRVRRLGERDVRAENGRPAILVGFKAMGLQTASLDVLIDRETFRLLPKSEK